MSAPAWVTLAALRPGAVFETRAGVLAVKSEYSYPNGGCECVLLASGEAAHFAQNAQNDRARVHNMTEVREVDVAALRARVAELEAALAAAKDDHIATLRANVRAPQVKP